MFLDAQFVEMLGCIDLLSIPDSDCLKIVEMGQGGEDILEFV